MIFPLVCDKCHSFSNYVICSNCEVYIVLIMIPSCVQQQLMRQHSLYLDARLAKIPRAHVNGNESRSRYKIHIQIAFRVRVCLCTAKSAHVCRAQASSCAGLNR